MNNFFCFFFSSRRRHTRFDCDWSSDVCSSDLQTTPLITRSQVQALAMGNAKVAQAVFSPESLQAKRNTEAIEVAPNTLMAARIIEYKPATPRPFDDVKTEIRRQLERRAASELAQAAGKEK